VYVTLVFFVDDRELGSISVLNFPDLFSVYHHENVEDII